MQLPISMASFVEATSKLPQQRIAKVLSFILLGYIAYLCAQITWMVLTPSAPHTFYPVSVGVDGKKSATKRLSIKELLSLNLFGSYQETQTEQIVEEEVLDAPETRLRLTLSATVASDQQSVAAAIIESSGNQETYGIGDSIIGTRATLEKVMTDRVLIKQSGRLETLMLDGFDYAKANKNQPLRASTKNKVSKTKSLTGRQVLPRSPNVVDQRKNKVVRAQAKKLKADIQNNPGKITDYLKISPKRKAGKVIGYQLMPGKNAEFFKSSGLKAGDVAIQMNGFDLKETSEAAQALTALKQEQEVSLLIMRGDELTEVLFSIDN